MTAPYAASYIFVAGQAGSGYRVMLLPTLILARRARTPPGMRAAQVPASETMCQL
jgi:hypothetical protein